LTLNTYSHVIGTTAHEQMSKINNLFADKPAKPESIIKQIEEGKEQVKKNDSPDKNKKLKDEHGL